MISLQLRNSRRSQGATRKSEILAESRICIDHGSTPGYWWTCKSIFMRKRNHSTIGLLQFCREFAPSHRLRDSGSVEMTLNICVYFICIHFSCLCSSRHTHAAQKAKKLLANVSHSQFFFFQWSTSSEQTTHASQFMCPASTVVYALKCILAYTHVERTQFQCQHVHVQVFIFWNGSGVNLAKSLLSSKYVLNMNLSTIFFVVVFAAKPNSIFIWWNYVILGTGSTATESKRS